MSRLFWSLCAGCSAALEAGLDVSGAPHRPRVSWLKSFVGHACTCSLKIKSEKIPWYLFFFFF